MHSGSFPRCKMYTQSHTHHTLLNDVLYITVSCSAARAYADSVGTSVFQATWGLTARLTWMTVRATPV